jgi:hypothetical protein
MGLCSRKGIGSVPSVRRLCCCVYIYDLPSQAIQYWHHRLARHDIEVIFVVALRSMLIFMQYADDCRKSHYGRLTQKMIMKELNLESKQIFIEYKMLFVPSKDKVKHKKQF